VLPIPATFIVCTDGIVTARFVDPDYRMRMAIEDMIAALAQFMEERRVFDDVGSAAVPQLFAEDLR